MICSADQYYCSVFHPLQEFNIQPGWRLNLVGMPCVCNMRINPAMWTHKSYMQISRHHCKDVGVQGEIGENTYSANWACFGCVLHHKCLSKSVALHPKSLNKSLALHSKCFNKSLALHCKHFNKSFVLNP